MLTGKTVPVKPHIPAEMKRAGRIRIRPREQGLSAVSASRPGNLHACILDLHANVAKIQRMAIGVLNFDLHIVSLRLDGLATNENLKTTKLRL